MRILGVDFGTTSIKAVELDSAFGRYEIHGYHERPVPITSPEERIQTCAEGLHELIMGLVRKPDRIVISLPTGATTLRNLLLPTKDKKAIQSSVAFELEDELPFPTEQLVQDYCVLGQTRQGSYLHVAATLKKRLEPWLNALEAAHVSPDVVTTEAWALRALVSRLVPAAAREEPTLLLHCGHERTVLYVQLGDAPFTAREIAWGGRDLTEWISQRLQIPIDQAESVKADPSAFGAIPLEEALAPLTGEAQQAALIAKSLTKKAPARLLHSGGPSLLPGLGCLMQEATGIETQTPRSLSGVSPGGVEYSEHTDATPAFASALALVPVKADRNSTINFRKGLFQKRNRS